MNAIVNGKIILEHEILQDHVLLYDCKIEKIIPKEQFNVDDCHETLDIKGAYVSPGFINEHIHGCAGFDVMDESEESVAMIRQSLPETGVTAFLPTTMTYDWGKIHRALERLRSAMKVDHGAKIIGANVEGPFISKPYKGAHDEQYIVKPEFKLIEDYTDVIKIMTVAPETIEEPDFIQKCRENGIILSLGHSAATYEEAIEAIHDGFTHITHMFNAMPVFNHRNPGVIGAAMDSDVICELITDNIHVHPAMQRILLKEKGSDKIVLVTDSMRACMLADGEYELGGQVVIVKDHTARLKNGVIAGSVLEMNQAVKNFKETSGLSLPEVIKMVTINPAVELGVYGEIGSISVGKQADLIIFNDQIEIMATIINGKVVYRRK